MQETCSSCRFAAVVVDPKFPGLVECRRRPPVAGGRPVAGWPQIHPDGWCGEFEPAVEVKRPGRPRKETTVAVDPDVETR